ncbi:HD-GYP domain-containing protein [Paenibacillus sp.]|uniref:HD-GYP domain-containing protein n=1 Tax=Paenibacillus sp. TaxID=58172 RepID=UPI002D4CD254|nr:HD domain-containing phosphohydrolase [Paenibacillus sp.]HZG55182.1 HD domain-containing phosphohydrolase [Paenibacillus sp.]
MRYVPIDALEPGQYLGRTIFSSNGAVLLSEGVQLTVYMISTLNRIGVTFVYVKDEHYDDIEIPEVISEETKRAVMRQMNEVFNTVRSGKEFNTKQVSVTIDSLLDDIMKNRDVLIHLSDIRSKENADYVHAMNVCMMSSVVGMNMGFTPTQMKELAIGALLHDIGKVGALPADDEDADRRRHHTWRGFETLKLKREYSLLIAHAAFQHHEHVDGTGLPRGLAGDAIHIYAKIVAVANTYDNLVSGLDEKGRRILPHEACERMMAMAGRALDKDVLIEFLKTVSVYPTGASVRLTNKEVGVVVGQHRGLPSRPVVRVVKNEDGQFEVKEFDLAKHPTLFIEAVLL